MYEMKLNLGRSNSKRKFFAVNSHDVKTPVKYDLRDLVTKRMERNDKISEIGTDDSMLLNEEFLCRQ
jgi:hypothetical protein